MRIFQAIASKDRIAFSPDSATTRSTSWCRGMTMPPCTEGNIGSQKSRDVLHPEANSQPESRAGTATCPNRPTEHSHLDFQPPTDFMKAYRVMKHLVTKKLVHLDQKLDQLDSELCSSDASPSEFLRAAPQCSVGQLEIAAPSMPQSGASTLPLSPKGSCRHRPPQNNVHPIRCPRRP